MATTHKHIRVWNREGILILEVLDRELRGEAQVDAWQNEMVAAIRAAQPRGVVLDMKNVEYLTSLALFPLVAARHAADEVGGIFVLCNLSTFVAKVLTVSQMIVESRPHAKHLRLANTLDDAVQMIESSS